MFFQSKYHNIHFPIFPCSGLSVDPGHPRTDISVTDKSSLTLHQLVIPGRSDREEAKKIPGIQKGNRGSENGDYLLSHLRSTIGVTKLNFSVRNGEEVEPSCHSHLNISCTSNAYENLKYISTSLIRKVNGQLVMLGFGVSTFTPASYQRHRL